MGGGLGGRVGGRTNAEHLTKRLQLIFGCTTVARTQTEVLSTCEQGIPGRVQEVYPRPQTGDVPTPEFGTSFRWGSLRRPPRPYQGGQVQFCLEFYPEFCLRGHSTASRHTGIDTASCQPLYRLAFSSLAGILPLSSTGQSDDLYASHLTGQPAANRLIDISISVDITTFVNPTQWHNVLWQQVHSPTIMEEYNFQ